VALRLGVFGGTFDPPHIGHLIAAVGVRYALGLDRVLFVVANEPWQKVGERSVSPARARLELVRAAVEGTEGLEASAVEIEHGGPSYTADTLTTLRRQEPHAELFLVLGYDAALGIESWERVDEVAANARLVVVDRPGSADDPLPSGFEWERVVAPRLEVSSTDLRERFSDGRPLDFLITDEVRTCIERLGLYRDRHHG
jgi:nicotinate-nucleotide adenylyltransferase